MNGKIWVIILYVLSVGLFVFSIFAYTHAGLTSWSEPFKNASQQFWALISIPSFAIGWLLLIIATGGYIIEWNVISQNKKAKVL